jgi:hypothetical protein
MVEPAEASGPEKMGEPVAAPLQFGIGDHFAGCCHDKGRLMWPQLGLQTRIHHVAPRSPLAVLSCEGCRPSTPMVLNQLSASFETAALF